MLAYFIVALVFLLCISKKIKHTHRLLSLMFLILFVLTAFRDVSVGTDTLNYRDWFNWYDDSSLTFRRGEYLFEFLIFVFRRLGLGYRTFLITTALLFYAPSYYVFRKKSRDPILSAFFLFFLGFCFLFFNLSRQLVAVSFGLLSMSFCERDQFGKFIVSIILAMLIHTSAIVLIFLWPIRQIQIRSGLWCVVLLVSFFVPFVMNTSGLFQAIASNIGLLGKYLGYATWEEKGVFSGNRLLMNFFYVFIMMRNPATVKTIWFKSSIMGVMVLNLFPTIPLLSRAYMYFAIAQTISFVDVYQKDKLMRLLTAFYSVAVWAVYIISNNGDIVPYLFSLES